MSVVSRNQEPNPGEEKRYTARARYIHLNPKHRDEIPFDFQSTGRRGSGFRRTLVELKPLARLQLRLRFRRTHCGVEDRFQTNSAKRIESAPRFRETGRSRGQSTGIVGDRHHECSSIRVPRRSRESAESRLTRLPSGGTRRCSKASTQPSVPSRSSLRGGISVRSEKRARHEVRTVVRRGPLSAFDDGIRRLNANTKHGNRRAPIPPENNERTEHRPTPVRKASAPPSPRWRSARSPDLSAGWRNVYRVLGVSER